MAFFHDFLSHREGLAGVALATSDAEGLHRGLVADGVAAQAPVEFSRPVALDGSTADARFRVMQVSPSETPAGQVFACQHFTRELVWRPEFQSHPVGVTGIAGIVVASEALRVLRSGAADPLSMADGSIAADADRAHGVALVFVPQPRALV